MLFDSMYCIYISVSCLICLVFMFVFGPIGIPLFLLIITLLGLAAGRYHEGCAYAVQVGDHYEVIVFKRRKYGPWSQVECNYKYSKIPSEDELARIANQYL